MKTDPLLDHLEKMFGDAYRKEVDQEENVWRSLPFFAATLALQLAGLAQIREWMANVGGAALLAAVFLLGVAGVTTFVALVFLGLSVWPANFDRVGDELRFSESAEGLRADAKSGSPRGATDEKAASAALKISQHYMLCVAPGS